MSDYLDLAELRKYIFKVLRSLGMERVHKSSSGSLYYRHPLTNVGIRISDHNLPQTEEREYGSGWMYGLNIILDPEESDIKRKAFSELASLRFKIIREEARLFLPKDHPVWNHVSDRGSLKRFQKALDDHRNHRNASHTRTRVAKILVAEISSKDVENLFSDLRKQDLVYMRKQKDALVQQKEALNRQVQVLDQWITSIR